MKVMRASITLKESFLKRRLADYPKPAEVTLSNGKTLDLAIILNEGRVEVTTKKGETIGTEKLSQEERSAIIEALLNEFTTFGKSFKHFTTQYNMEQFKLVDATYVDNPDLSEDLGNGTKSMLLEYFCGEYSANSRNVLFRQVKTIYEVLLEKFKKNEFEEDIEIPLEYDFTRFQAVDLRFFTKQLIHAKKWAVGIDFDVEINKERTTLTVEIEKLD